MRCKGVLKRYAHVIKAVNFSADNKNIYTLSYFVCNSYPPKEQSIESSPKINIWDIQTGNLVKHKSFSSTSMVIYFDEQKAITLDNNTITLFNFNNADESTSLTLGQPGYIHRKLFQIFPDGKRIAIALEQNLYVLDLSNLSVINSINHSSNISDIVVSPDNKSIIFVDENCLIYIFDSKDCSCSKHKLYKIDLMRTFEHLCKIILNPCGNLLLAVSNCNAYLYYLENNHNLWTIKFPPFLHYLCFSNDGSCIIGISYSKLYIWESETGKRISNHSLDKLELVDKECKFFDDICMRYNPANNQLILAGDRDTAYVYNISCLKNEPIEELIKVINSKSI